MGLQTLNYHIWATQDGTSQSLTKYTAPVLHGVDCTFLFLDVQFPTTLYLQVQCHVKVHCPTES